MSEKYCLQDLFLDMLSYLFILPLLSTEKVLIELELKRIKMCQLSDSVYYFYRFMKPTLIHDSLPIQILFQKLHLQISIMFIIIDIERAYTFSKSHLTGLTVLD